MIMRGPRLLRGGLLPLTISLVAGGAIGVLIAGMPDSGALTNRDGSPVLTVKPGSLIDPTDLTVPSLLTVPGPVPPAPDVPGESSTTSNPDDGLRARADLVVVVSNANGTNGLARAWADRAITLGYPDPDLSTGATTTDTVVYYAEGFDGEAERLVAELATTPIEIRPIASAPVTSPPFTGQLLVLIGKNVPEIGS